MAGQHYLVLTFAVGKDGVRREHFPVHADDTVDSALSRWVASHPTMHGRVRNKERQERLLRASVIGARIARPSSHYADEIAAREARGIDHEAIAQAIASGRRRNMRYR